MRHDQAIQAYHRGQRNSALVILNEIASNSEIEGSEVQLSALVYMGEIHFVRNEERDRELAEQIFRRVIRTNPSYVLDPFRHPPDVAAFFNAVKITMDPAELAGPLPLSIRPPRYAWSPLGVYDFRQGRSARAWIGGGAQALTGISSLVLAGILLDRHDWDVGGIPYPEGDEEALSRINRLQTANLLSFMGFYTAWGLSVSSAHRHWRRQAGQQSRTLEQATQMSVALSVDW